MKYSIHPHGRLELSIEETQAEKGTIFGNNAATITITVGTQEVVVLEKTALDFMKKVIHSIEHEV